MVSLGALSGCRPQETDSNAARGSAAPHIAAPAAATVMATATLSPASGSDVRGEVTFTREENDNVRVIAEITGLAPGLHGFHIHENGDCSAPDATSAGAHFNPAGMPHAGPDDSSRHAGDLGNVEADTEGKARYSRVIAGLHFYGEASLIGRAVIVHAKADDLKTQPAGDAGDRVACGVIEKR